MLQRALGLGAPEFIGRDLDGAHRVFSLRCVVITFSLDEKCVIATKLTCLKRLSIGQIDKLFWWFVPRSDIRNEKAARGRPRR